MVTVVVSLRAATEADAGFLWRVHAAAMRDQVARAYGVWNEAEQEARFRAHLRLADNQVVMHQGQAVGALELQHRPNEEYLARMEVLPEFQNRGIGGAILREVVTHADRRGVPITLNVFKVNAAARRLYERFGFTLVGETTNHHQLQRPRLGMGGEAKSTVMFAEHRAPAVAGRDLLTLLLERGAPISYVCMAGTCGTCRVRVCAGASHLDPMTDSERAHFPESRGEIRLACQAIVLGTGDVVIEQD